MIHTPSAPCQNKHLVLEGVSNRLVLATLENIKTSEGGIILPGFGLYRRDSDYIASGLEFIAAATEKPEGWVDEALKEFGEGYWDAKGGDISPYTLAIVIGENPRLDYIWNGPRFGDVLLVWQMASTEYHGMHKLGAGITANNGILIKNSAGDRSITLSHEACVLSTPVDDVIGLVARHSEIQEWANHGCRADTGESRSATCS